MGAFFSVPIAEDCLDCGGFGTIVPVSSIFRGFRARKRRFRHARAGFALGCSLVVCCSSRWFRALFRWCFVPIDLLRSTNAGHSVFGNFGAFCR